MSLLSTNLATLQLKNPVMLAAGILGISGETLREIVDSGAGAVVTKSIGLEPRVGYPNPTVIQVDCGIINAVGLPNPGIYNFAKEIKKLNGVEAPLIVSVYGFSSREYSKVARFDYFHWLNLEV